MYDTTSLYANKTPAADFFHVNPQDQDKNTNDNSNTSNWASLVESLFPYLYLTPACM